MHRRLSYLIRFNNNNVDGSLLALEYQAMLDAERRLHLARSDPPASNRTVVEGSIRMGSGSDSTSQGASSHNQDLNTTSSGEEVSRRQMGMPLPKSTLATTIRSDTDDNNNICCGQCDNPIMYCHCEPLPVHTHVVLVANTNRGGAAPAFPRRTIRGTVVLHDWTQAEDLNDDDLNHRGREEEDDEEALLPCERVKGKEGEVVSHGGRGRVSAEGNAGGGVPTYCPREGAAATSRKGKRARSITPEGYVVNQGTAYVPMTILQDGRRTPAKYVRIIMSNNPEVFGTMGQGEPIFHAKIHVAWSHDYEGAAEYSSDDLKYLRADYAKS